MDLVFRRATSVDAPACALLTIGAPPPSHTSPPSHSSPPSPPSPPALLAHVIETSFMSCVAAQRSGEPVAYAAFTDRLDCADLGEVLRELQGVISGGVITVSTFLSLT